MRIAPIDRPLVLLLAVIAAELTVLIVLSIPAPPILPIGADNMGDVADWWMFGVTTLLLVVGIAQLWMFYRQLDSMRIGLEQTTKAAEAARASADAAINSERAILYLDVYAQTLSASQDDRSGFTRVSFSVKNYGKTPAKLDAAFAVLLNEDNVIDFKHGQLTVQTVVAPNDLVPVYEFEVPWQPLASDQPTAEQRRRYATLRPSRPQIFGNVTYLDVFGTSRILKFHISVAPRTSKAYISDHREEPFVRAVADTRRGGPLGDQLFQDIISRAIKAKALHQAVVPTTNEP